MVLSIVSNDCGGKEVKSHLSIKPMSIVSASEICKWKYSKPYDIYNLSSDTKEELLNCSYFEVRNNMDELIGFYCFGKEAQVPGWNYDNKPIDIGLGLKPSLTGKGLGYEFVKEGITFAQKQFIAKYFRLTVAAFNLRAIQTYEKVGFTLTSSFYHPKTNKLFHVMNLTKEG
jgi:[ribosomal protein S18]-alanine N-acetyltransferase